MADLLHNPLVRSCIELMPKGFPRGELRDDIRCPACDAHHGLIHLDPDVLEVLSREPWCASCIAGDKAMATSPEQTGDTRP